MRCLYLFQGMLALLFTLQSCSKNDNDPDTAPDEPKYKYLLRSIDWDNGVKQVFAYNADSTIKSVQASLAGAGSVVNYVWVAGQMKALSVDASLYTNHYSYNSNGLVSEVVNSYKNDPSHSFYKLEFSYNTNKTVNILTYSTINEAGTHLQTTTRYEYKSNGDLYKAITESAGNVITYVIDEYSAECEIYPWIYVSSSLDEFYTLYNYPVISNMKKFPAKISRIFKIGQGAPETDRIEKHTLFITNKRIDKTITEIEYPKMPQNNKKIQRLYNYF